MDSDVEAEVMAQLLVFAEQTTDFVGVADAWGRVLYVNPAARKRLGVADAADLTVADIFPVEEFTLYYEVVRPQLLRAGTWSGEVRLNVAGGDPVPMYVSVSTRLGPGAETNGIVMYAHEITPLTPAAPVAAVVESDVNDDTGLLESSAFAERVRLALAVAARDGDPCALVLATVSNMHATIEAFDAPTAATVMRTLAGRMTSLARTVDVVGHVDDYQLGLLLLGVRTRGEAQRLARMVHESLVDAPVPTPSGDVAAFVESGVAFSEPGDDLVDLIERASVAMSHERVSRDASDGGGSITTTHAGRLDDPVTMDEFRLAMSHGAVRPYAQPVVDLGSGRVVGYRGFARWHHRRLGTLDAAAFVPMIAETPLASQVDLYVARETAAVLALTSRDRPLSLYAPVSKQLVADIRAEQYLTEIADAFSLSVNQMHLQLERSLIDDWSPALHDALASLRDADVAFVLTGVERIADTVDINEFAFRELHLARALTNDIAHAADARRTVSAIVRLAHDRGMLVAASGIGDEEHRDALIAAGCDLVAGDLYGKAEPADSID